MAERVGSPRIAGEDLRMPPSLWAATAVPPPATVPLLGASEAEIVVVGGGFTGLSAALHLAQAGRSVMVLEAAEIGWGASGRNNGQVIPGLKLDPDEIEARFGKEQGARVVAWAGAAPAEVFSLIERFGIRCDALNEGWIQPVYSKSSLPTIEHRCRQWRERGAPVQMLEADRLPSLLGTHAFHGAWMDSRGGTIQPLSYARGLAAAAAALGARIHTRSFVQELSSEGGVWTVRTPEGRVMARDLVLATNAYGTGLVPGLRETIVPVRTAQVASRPLDEPVRRMILPGRQGASDTRRLLTSFRLSADGRLVMGGSGATGLAHRASLESHLHRSARELFGHLGPIEWEYGWSGYLALTPDHIPHLHEPQERLHVALGCNGRGIALMTAIGRLLAERILTKGDMEPVLPVTPHRPVRFHAVRNVGIAAATLWKRALDKAERRRSR